MTTQEILDEIRKRSGDDTLQNDVLLTKINNEYAQTNLGIINLNEDYFLTEKSDFAVTTSAGPFSLPADFGKFRGLWTPGDSFVPQRRPRDRKGSYGWYFAGTTTAALKQIKFTDTPKETGNYLLQYVAFPGKLDTTTPVNPVWPEVFHEILILGGLERLFSIEDIWEKYGDLRTSKQELRDALLSQVGGLNLGVNRTVEEIDDIS